MLMVKVFLLMLHKERRVVIIMEIRYVYKQPVISSLLFGAFLMYEFLRDIEASIL